MAERNETTGEELTPIFQDIVTPGVDAGVLLNTNTTSETTPDKGPNVGAIVGGVLAGLVLIAALIILVISWIRYKKLYQNKLPYLHNKSTSAHHQDQRVVTALDNPALTTSQGNVYTLENHRKAAVVPPSQTGTLNRDYELVMAPNSTSVNNENIQDSVLEVSQVEAPIDELVSDRWEIPRNHVKMVEKLGQGRFGHVWKSEVTDPKHNMDKHDVAIKMLKDKASELDTRDFLRELDVMKKLPPHPNVLGLLACCTNSVPMMIILEYMSLGDLKAFLRSGRSSHTYGNLHGGSHSFTSRDLLTFAYQVASGMSHISEHQLLHRDLAARNVLVNGDCVCKVSDFGLSRDVINNHIYHRKSQGPLPVRWMAPESIFENEFTTQSDVWSFGVLLWEIVTLGSSPYPGLKSKELLRLIRSGEHMQKPQHCGEQVYAVMEECWRMLPDERPNFASLVVQLDQLLNKEEECLDIEQLQLSLREELPDSITE